MTAQVKPRRLHACRHSSFRDADRTCTSAGHGICCSVAVSVIRGSYHIAKRGLNCRLPCEYLALLLSRNCKYLHISRTSHQRGNMEQTRRAIPSFDLCSQAMCLFILLHISRAGGRAVRANCTSIVPPASLMCNRLEAASLVIGCNE